MQLWVPQDKRHGAPGAGGGPAEGKKVIKGLEHLTRKSSPAALDDLRGVFFPA